jgi:thiol-disulfide isomerase/thioredoxin
MESQAEARSGTSSAAWRALPPALRIGLLAAFLVAVGAAIWLAQGAGSAPAGAPRVGSQAPAFTLADSAGKPITLGAYRGRPVLINFWATWCVPCQTEMPAINAVAQAHPNTVILAVDVLEGPALVGPFVEQHHLTFDPVLDPTGEVAGRYHVDSLPSSFFVAPDGTIRAINVGPMDQPTIEANLAKSS